MKPGNQGSGKMMLGGKSVGSLTPEDLEQRAREIALIAGRREPSSDDRAQARRELLGRDLPDTVSDDAETSASLSRDPSDPPAVHGKQVPDYNEPNEDGMIERLAVGGVEEAQHEQMLAARRAEEEAEHARNRRGHP